MSIPNSQRKGMVTETLWMIRNLEQPMKLVVVKECFQLPKVTICILTSKITADVQLSLKFCLSHKW